MISLDVLLDMIATEAIGGESRDHYFDEFRNREYVPEPRYMQPETKTKLPPIKFDLELIRELDGSLYWVE